MTKLFAIIKFHWLHELSNKYYMYKHNIQHHCYKACMTNCYPVEPLPFFSPSLHKFNWEFYPSIRTEDEVCTLGVVHNATDINLLFCFLLRTPRDAAYENQCHFASLSHGMHAKKKIIVPRKIFPWHNISVKEKLVVCTI